MLEKDIKKVLFSQEDIVAKTKELGQQLTEDYAGKNPLLVCVLKGAVPFMAELIKHIDTHIEMDFMVVSSYGGGTVSSGEVKILKDVDTNVEGRDIIFIEDIIDTGRTLLYLRDMFKYRKANSVKIATLFDKPEGRVVDIEADYVCYDVPNEFIVGFGLDYDEKYRNLPYVQKHVGDCEFHTKNLPFTFLFPFPLPAARGSLRTNPQIFHVQVGLF